ncbi:MAG: acetylornithine deacetylase/succinyl-diaminopimelate desuccinylase family protein [Pseudomonadota bacterium]
MQTEEALSRWIDDHADDLVRLTQDLVRFPTVNPPGEGYLECAEFVRDRLSNSGFETQLIRAESADADSEKHPRYNVLARADGSDSGPTVHFNSHIDVVPTGVGWSVDPFGGDVKDGKVFGRGTCDMKGGLAASILAAEAIRAVFPNHPGSLEVSATADEETGGFAGVAWLAARGFLTSKTIDHVIIPEPFSPDRICVGHRGVWWGEITTYGTIAHGSMPFLGDCALRHMSAVVQAFEEKLFPRLSERTTGMPVTPPDACRATLNLATMHAGGDAEEISGVPAPNVPDVCTMIFDRRYLIEESSADVKAEIVEVLDDLTQTRPGFRYALRDLMLVEPLMTPQPSAVVAATQAAISSVLGKEAAIVASPGTYDHKHFTRIGGIGDCIAYGPGKLEVAHQVDEYVEIADLVASAKVMAVSAMTLLNDSKA